MTTIKHIQSTFVLFFAPEGKLIATVQATTRNAAIRKAPKPYRKYLGEIHAEAIANPTHKEHSN